MGCYTSVVHPEDGRELQIKCGHDRCMCYKLGDNVGQYVCKDRPKHGYLLDDVYDSYSSRGEDDWVIIKDGVIAAVEPRAFEEDGSFNWGAQYDALREKYQIKEYPDNLWTEEGWERACGRSRVEAEFEKLKKETAGKSLAESLGTVMCYQLRKRTDWSSTVRGAFQVEPFLQEKKTELEDPKE